MPRVCVADTIQLAYCANTFGKKRIGVDCLWNDEYSLAAFLNMSSMKMCNNEIEMD